VSRGFISSFVRNIALNDILLLQNTAYFSASTLVFNNKLYEYAYAAVKVYFIANAAIISLTLLLEPHTHIYIFVCS